MNDFMQHSCLFMATLAVIMGGVALHAPAEILAPLSQGLGMALPALLAGHAVVAGVTAWTNGKAALLGNVDQERGKDDSSHA